MPYSRLVNVASYDALLGEIRNFLNATGDWTLHVDLGTPDEGAASAGRELVASNGDVLVGLRSTTSGAGANRLYLFDGVPPYAGSPSFDQLNDNSGQRYTDAIINSANTPAVRHVQQFAGPFPTCHLFTDDPSTYCHVAIEVTAGKWRHLHFGNITKFTAWTGGGYYSANYWSQAANQINSASSSEHMYPFDNQSIGNTLTEERGWTLHYDTGGGDDWLAPDQTDLTSGTRLQGRATVRNGFGQAWANLPESPYSGLIALAPIVLARVRTSDTPPTIRSLGMIPDLRLVNLRNIAPAQTLPIGSDEWICFPVSVKNGLAGSENSADYGLAYLKRA